MLLRAFGQYLGLQPPWNVVLLSTALYGGVALVLLHFAGAACCCMWSLVGCRCTAAACMSAGIVLLQRRACLQCSRLLPAASVVHDVSTTSGHAPAAPRTFAYSSVARVWHVFSGCSCDEWPGQGLAVPGLLGSALATTWGALLLMVFSAAAAVAAGMPVLLLPAPMLAASGLALFQVHCVLLYISNCMDLTSGGRSLAQAVHAHALAAPAGLAARKRMHTAPCRPFAPSWLHAASQRLAQAALHGQLSKPVTRTLHRPAHVSRSRGRCGTTCCSPQRQGCQGAGLCCTTTGTWTSTWGPGPCSTPVWCSSQAWLWPWPCPALRCAEALAA